MKLKLFFGAILLVAIFCFATTAFAMTDQERNTLIAQLQTQIAQLMQQLVQLQEQTQLQDWCHTFNTNLGFAKTGNSEVSALHAALQKLGISYSPDTGTTYGQATAMAVKQFQEMYASEILHPLGLTNGTGYFGTTTRAKLNQLYGCTIIQPTCTPDWSCLNWSTCSNSQQTRSCYDTNYCGIDTNKPSLTQGCVLTCTPNCTNNTCGSDDGCGGKCQTGNCPGNATCSNGVCGCSSYTKIDWSCTQWSVCLNNQQTRNCLLPVGACYEAKTEKPAEVQSCSSSCTPSWQCSSWSSCLNSKQTRTCTDLNDCGVSNNQLESMQTCTNNFSIEGPTVIDDGNCIGEGKYVYFFNESAKTYPRTCCQGLIKKGLSINHAICVREWCGDKICNNKETSQSCPYDCQDSTLNQ